MKVSLESLIQRLISKGTAEARATLPASPGSASPTSIRLKPATKHFFECQAVALNTSVQALIGIVLDGVAETSVDPTTSILRTLRERFFHLFKAHDLDLPGVVSVLKNHGFTLSVLDDPARLMDLINQPTISYLSQVFSVRAEWISAASDTVVDRGVDFRWYKNVYAMGSKLLQFAGEGLQPDVLFIRRRGADFERARQDNDEGRWPEEPIGVVVRLYRTTEEGVKFKTYEMWEFERWNYWRCRQQFKFLITFCDQARQEISYSGIELDEEEIRSLREGKVLPATLVGGIQMVAWYPEDYASLNHEVTAEPEEWSTIKKDYENGRYEKILTEWRQRKV